MLPKFTNLENDLSEYFHSLIQQAIRTSNPAIARTREFICHEGDSHKRFDSSPRPFRLSMENIFLNKHEWKKMTFEELRLKLRELGAKIAYEQLTYLVKQLEDAASEGQIPVNTVGKDSFAVEILNMLEQMKIDFDKNGYPIPPQFIGGGDFYRELPRALSEIEGNPEYRKRYIAIVTRKREEWRDREASRKLVD
jgi:hypothetical protein